MTTGLILPLGVPPYTSPHAYQRVLRKRPISTIRFSGLGSQVADGMMEKPTLERGAIANFR